VHELNSKLHAVSWNLRARLAIFPNNFNPIFYLWSNYWKFVFYFFFIFSLLVVSNISALFFSRRYNEIGAEKNQSNFRCNIIQWSPLVVGLILGPDYLIPLTEWFNKANDPNKILKMLKSKTYLLKKYLLIFKLCRKIKI